MLDAYPSNLSDTGGKMRKGTLKSVIASALMALLLLGLPLKAAGHSPDPIDPPSHSQLLVPLLTPITKVITDV
ncbi:MAG TPA: hypothetical protein VLI04_06240, partial [Nocardioidaceae bacterium]|nr:hypothetical protein [Nocardioidaceae bacterium]